MKLNKFIGVLILGATIFSACSEKSLQKYLVEKQDDDKFVKIDLATSLLQGKNSDFSEAEKDILKTIKKINIVAYPIKKGDTADFQKEKKELTDILDQERYKELTRFKSNSWDATLKYTGEEDALDEVIVFASDNRKGFAVFRLLGDNMRPDQMLQLMRAAERGEMDILKVGGFTEIFRD